MLPLPKIGVWLAAWNGMLWIEERLNSIQSQFGVEVYLFISVNPSTDGTFEWCQGYVEKWENVTLLLQVPSSGSAAENFFRSVKSVDFKALDYIAFADQDDLWNPGKLQRGGSQLALRSIDGYSSNAVAFWPDGRRCLLDKSQPQVGRDYLFEPAGPGCTYLITQKLASNLQQALKRQIDDMRGVALHDWYIYAFARSLGYQWYMDKEATVEYRQHPANAVGANVELMSMVSRMQLIRSGWWFGQIKLITHVVGRAEEPDIRAWLPMRRSHFLGLAFQTSRYRRRRRDQLALMWICLLMAAFGGRTV